MKFRRLPLFWKFSLAIAATVILFGSINLWFIRNQVYKTFESQIEKYGISIALGLAERSVDPILYDDLAALNQLLTQTKTVNPDIKYIFVLDFEKRLIAHTFKDYVPRGIIGINQIPKGKDINVKILRDETDRKLIIRDIAIPIMEQQIGTVRIGMSEDAFLKDMRSITTLFLGMVLFFLILGIIAAFVLSYIITSPIKSISSHAKKVSFNSLNLNESISIKPSKHFSVRLKNLFNLTDEIDVLTSTFNEMLNRIQKAYRDLKNAHESLSQTEKMASVGTLTAGLAHEINNPLAGIRNCIRRIESNPDNIRQNAEYIAMMSEALGKIEGVINGMLNFSRKQELVFINTNIYPLIENSISLVKYQLEKSKIKLVREFSEEQTTLNASPNHLEQVFVNILLNSIDAINERREIDIELDGEIIIHVDSDDNYTCIKFTDNGIGLPPDKVAAIFDPFFTMKKIKQGTGLGLAVSYNIINSHNGQIRGENMENGGFAISIKLPKTNRK